MMGCTAKVTTTQSNLVNLQQNKQAVDTYYTEGQYISDVASIVEGASKYLNSALASGKYSKPAIVFDVDDTLLANNQIYKDMGYSFSLRMWRQWINMAQIPSIDPMRELYATFVGDVDIFIITGRNVLQKSQTLRNLKEAGYGGWKTVFFRQQWDVDLTAELYKSKIISQLINEEGYQIIANFGDQESDFGVTIQGKNFKLPNYLYITK